MEKLKVTVTEEQRLELESISEEASAHHETIERLSLSMNKSKRKLWKKIREFVPESKGINCGYNSETGLVEEN